MNYKDIFINKGLVNIQKFFYYMQKNFQYGWLDQDGNSHYGVNDAKKYCLQSPNELIKSNLGICWDMTELCRVFFENMTFFKYETYFLFYDDNKGCPSHSILVFYDNNKVYWFEPMFQNKDCYYSGIHEYKNIVDLLKDFKSIFLKNSLLNNLIPQEYYVNNFKLYKYQQPLSHINGYQIRNHIDKSELINID